MSFTLPESLTSIQFNNHEYNVELILSNGTDTIPLPVGILKDIYIRDSIFSVFKEGYVSFDNTGNVIDSLGDSAQEAANRVFTPKYAFNTDSRDTLSIKIKPKGPVKDDEWLISHNFFVADEIDTLSDTGFVKTKTFVLVEVAEQRLSEDTTQWSTSNVVFTDSQDKVNLSQVSNDLRKAYTGLGIKNRIQSCLGKNIIFADDWNKGLTKTFYTSPNNASAFDDIEYMLDEHVSPGQKGFCLLGRERNGKFFLRPLESYYNRILQGDTDYDSYLIDAFNVQTGEITLSQDPTNNFDMVETNIYGLTKAQISNFNTLPTYQYVNMSNKDSIREFITTHSHNYSSSSKQFTIDSRDTHAVALRNKAQRLYADIVNGQTVFPLSDEKIENIICKHEYTGGNIKDERIAKGINQVLKKLFGLAPSISYDIDGSTARTSGRFALFASSDAVKNATMSKVLIGEWFTTTVDHYFAVDRGGYKNTVVCVKPHASEPIVDDDIIAMYDGYYKNRSLNIDSLGFDETQTAIV